ncbi:unnamed protein product, partial [Didymodactylos carnosus]
MQKRQYSGNSASSIDQYLRIDDDNDVIISDNLSTATFDHTKRQLNSLKLSESQREAIRLCKREVIFS